MNTPENSYFITNTDTIFTRWYAGSRYIKETEGSTTKQYTATARLHRVVYKIASHG
ncbi:MAG: hypothetical protein L3J11_02650 [Draconibacterium sp.]|nr:hypothetical protein [Draconibacterium sp.]